MKIVCDDKIPFIRGVFEPYAEVEYLSGQETTHSRLRGVDALVTRTRTICDKNLLQGTPVRVIASATIGFDHIDTRWCEEHGIVWRNAPGCNSGSVAQYVASVLLNLARMHRLDLSQMTLGIVGVGHVGTKVAEVARAFGMRVLLNDPPRAAGGEDGFVSLDELISGSDIVTLHVPLVREGEYRTHHLFDEKRVSAMRGKFLINTSRGPVVDNAALREALENKPYGLKGAALDVWEGEPNIDRRLLDLLDIATPHIAGYSADGKANGTGAAVRTVSEVLDLPLRGWSPDGLPAPTSLPLDFEIDPTGKSAFEILTEAVLHTYDVRSDSDALRSASALPYDTTHCASAGEESDSRHACSKSAFIANATQRDTMSSRLVSGLRSIPDNEFASAFERLRDDYPIRREPSAFTIRLSSPVSPSLLSSLRTLGFKVIK